MREGLLGQGGDVGNCQGAIVPEIPTDDGLAALAVQSEFEL